MDNNPKENNHKINFVKDILTRKSSLLAAVIIPFVAGFASVFSLFFLFTSESSKTTDLSSIADELITKQLIYKTSNLNVDKVNKTLYEHEQTLKSIKNDLDNLTNIDSNAEFGVQISLLKSDINSLNSRMQSLENGLLDNPEKALSVPLMRRDIENIVSSNQYNFLAVAKNIDRVYDQNKWFIGLMCTMAIGLISLAISNFVQTFKKPQ